MYISHTFIAFNVSLIGNTRNATFENRRVANQEDITHNIDYGNLIIRQYE